MPIFLRIFLLTLLAVFQVSDVEFTKQIEARGGREANPIVARVVEWSGWNAVIYGKIALVLVLALGWRHKHFDKILVGITSVYFLLNLYHIFLLYLV